ncbi:hypothetical protein K7432_018164 [Basidiobolus ranarum]|uniref:Uncharacterized protein n=1 Tax=Basidiobolus ranarum TaxID=34480 RepID=A0ABR2WCH7_9FUNG
MPKKPVNLPQSLFRKLVSPMKELMKINGKIACHLKKKKPNISPLLITKNPKERKRKRIKSLLALSSVLLTPVGLALKAADRVAEELITLGSMFMINRLFPLLDK